MLDRHPQSFGNYFTYGAALSILGVPPASVFLGGSMKLAPTYCDFGYMWSQIGPPESALAALQAGISRDEAASYSPDMTDELRDIVAELMFGRRRDAAFDVLGTEGAQGAIGYSFLSFLDPGDEVIITDPAYMHFGPGPGIAGARVRTIPLSPANRFRLDPDEVAATFTRRTKMLVVCDPINPFGVVQTKEELLALARLCERRNVLILHNTTHATHRTNPAAVHTPLAALSNETSVDHVISISGVSKGYGLASLRLGFMAGHPNLLCAAARIRMEVTGIHINPFAQRAALAALQDRPYVQDATNILRRNLRHLRETLERIGEVHLTAIPDYGFCACLDVAASGISAQELTVALFRRGICVIAGDALGEVGATRYVRLNYSTPEIGNLERLRHALPLAIRDARSGRYLEGIKAFYRNHPTSRARRILATLEARVQVATARGTAHPVKSQMHA